MRFVDTLVEEAVCDSTEDSAPPSSSLSADGKSFDPITVVPRPRGRNKRIRTERKLSHDLRFIVATNIRAFRLAKKWTTGTMARRLRMKTPQIAHMEMTRRQANLTLATVDELARLFQIPAYALLMEDTGLALEKFFGVTTRKAIDHIIDNL